MVRRLFQERRCRGRASLMGQRSALRSAATARIGSGSWRWKKGWQDSDGSKVKWTGCADELAQK
jgi:hypothetical protein